MINEISDFLETIESWKDRNGLHIKECYTDFKNKEMTYTITRDDAVVQVRLPIKEYMESELKGKCGARKVIRRLTRMLLLKGVETHE